MLLLLRHVHLDSTASSTAPGQRLPRVVQDVSAVVAKSLRLFVRVRSHIPHRRVRRLRRGPSPTPLILAANHEVMLDPWLLQVALGVRTWHAMAPIRALGTQEWTGVYARLRPLLLLMYRGFGVVRLPRRSKDLPREAKLDPLVDALRRGEVAGIFPEGHRRGPGETPVRELRPGVVLLHRRTGAPILPTGIRYETGKGRRRCLVWMGEPVSIPRGLEVPEASQWLRQRLQESYDRTRELD